MDDPTIIIGFIIIVVVVAAAALFLLRRAEMRMQENGHKLRVYTDLLNAITDLNLSGGDPYRMDIAKKNLAMTLNRLNLVGSIGVLKSTNDLLDFLNEHRDREFDTLRLHNILNTLVIEARRDLNPAHARKVEDAQVRFRFFAPPRR